jgi:3-oxoacyl-(acyl-carrier-protein) synthase
MNCGLEIERWSFWSPETRSPSQWRGLPMAADDIPEGAIPAAHRRRMSTMSKLAVQVALEAANGSRPDFLVFCSQHGEMERTSALLANIASREELSPTAFSQSVHNASAGLYTIVTQTHAPASAVASGASTFAYGWLEAEAYLVHNPLRRALLVGYDDLLPEEYLPYSTQTRCVYAVALALRLADRDGVGLKSVPADTDELRPLAPLFMAWWCSGEETLRITADGQGWEWKRRNS